MNHRLRRCLPQDLIYVSIIRHRRKKAHYHDRDQKCGGNRSLRKQQKQQRGKQTKQDWSKRHDNVAFAGNRLMADRERSELFKTDPDIYGLSALKATRVKHFMDRQQQQSQKNSDWNINWAGVRPAKDAFFQEDNEKTAERGNRAVGNAPNKDRTWKLDCVFLCWNGCFWKRLVPRLVSAPDKLWHRFPPTKLSTNMIADVVRFVNFAVISSCSAIGIGPDSVPC